MATATNPATGERVYLDEATNTWLPAKTATNPETGEKVFFDGKGWQPLAPQAAGPPLDPSFTPGTQATAPSLLSRRAVEPQWPKPQGAAVAPFPLSDMGLPPDYEPEAVATAFPQPEGRFPPAPGAPPVQADYPVSDIPAQGLGAETPWALPDFKRDLKLGTQAVGTGAINTAMFLPDLPLLAAQGLYSGLGAGAKAFGLDELVGAKSLPEQYGRPISPPLPSEVVKSGIGWLANQAGYEAATPSTPGEKAMSNILQYGTEGLTGSALLRQVAKGRAAEVARPGALPSRIDPYVKPYYERPLQTIAGDTLAGGAAGAAVTVPQEFIPENVRAQGGGTVGALSDLFAMLYGGASGGTLANILAKAPGRVSTLAQANRPAADIAIDPVTGMYVTNQAADEAARILQSTTTGDPRAVAQQTRERVQQFRDQGLPVPTTGLLTEDIGLAGLEKRQRTREGPSPVFEPDTPADVRQQSSFSERDQALRRAAAENVQSIRQPGVDPGVFPQRAQERGEMLLEQAQRQVDQPTGAARGVQQAREIPAAKLAAQRGQTPGASRNIFERYETTRALEREQTKALYADPAWNQSTVDANPLLDAAGRVRATGTPANPVNAKTDEFLTRIETARDSGVMTGQDLTNLKDDIELAIQEGGLKKGNLFRQLKALKDGVSNTIAALPKDHPGKQAVLRAEENFRTRVVPQFREGVGQTLDRRLKSSPGQVYPETAGAEFLNRAQDAQQLMRIGELRGTGPAMATDARTILLDRLAQGGVIKDGAIDPTKLTAWRNQRAEIIQSIPGLDNEINNLIRGAQRGAGLESRYASEISDAEKRLTQTTKDVERGPLSLAAGKDPGKAVTAILQSDNAPENMRKLREQMGNNPAANASLKAATADHFMERVRAIDPNNPEDFAVRLEPLVRDFNKHRNTMIAAGFTPEEMQALQRAQTVLMPLLKKRVQATVGSTTAESTEAAMRPLELALKGYYGILKGGGVFRTLKIAMKTAMGDTNLPIEQLVTRAMFDPEVAATLLTRDVKKAGTPAWNAQLQKAIRRMAVAKDVLAPEQETEAQ